MLWQNNHLQSDPLDCMTESISWGTSDCQIFTFFDTWVDNDYIILHFLGGGPKEGAVWSFACFAIYIFNCHFFNICFQMDSKQTIFFDLNSWCLNISAHPVQTTNGQKETIHKTTIVDVCLHKRFLDPQVKIFRKAFVMMGNTILFSPNIIEMRGG